MQAIESLLTAIDSVLGSAPWFPFVLLGVGLFFTIYLGVPQVRYFRHAWKVLTGKFDRKGAPGDTSHFQALSTALSGTVGTGNIGGVAFALFLGGPAALFWMWATAFLGMTTKFVEVTVSYKYRYTDSAGFICGGPMCYMEKGMNAKWLAVLFALATVLSSFGSGNMPQANNIVTGLQASFGWEPAITGALLAVALGLVIIGGITRIAKVTSTLVPVMGVLYAFGAIAVLVSNIDNVGPALAAVFADAFTGSAAAGGFLGASFAYAFNRGVNRGLFSNEAGQGSAPIAHASARGDEPVSEGMVSILEPFIDTIIICTLTGTVILASGAWNEKHDTQFQRFDTDIVAGAWTDTDPAHVDALRAHLTGAESPVASFTGQVQVREGRVVDDSVTVLHNRSVAEQVVFFAGERPITGVIDIADGKPVDPEVVIEGRSLLHSVELTTEAFKRSFLGDSGQYIVTIGLLLFAFSTAIAWSYYGDRAITYLFGVQWILPYRVVYVAGFFAACIADTSLVWLFSAITIIFMALPNLVGIVWLRKEMKQEVADYWTTFRKEHPEPAKH